MTDFSTRARSRPADGRALVFLAAAVLAFAWSARRSWLASTELVRARTAVESARRETESLLLRLRVLEPRRDSPGEALAARALLTAEAPLRRVLADISALLPPDVRLESMSLSYADALDVDLGVRARRAEAYDLFVSRLQESKRFSSVQPGLEDRGVDVRSSLRVRYRGEGSS